MFLLQMPVYITKEFCFNVTLQLLSSVLKKKVNVDKDHVKAIHKMTQSMHEDSNIRQLKFEGYAALFATLIFFLFIPYFPLLYNLIALVCDSLLQWNP